MTTRKTTIPYDWEAYKTRVEACLENGLVAFYVFHRALQDNELIYATSWLKEVWDSLRHELVLVLTRPTRKVERRKAFQEVLAHMRTRDKKYRKTADRFSSHRMWSGWRHLEFLMPLPQEVTEHFYAIVKKEVPSDFFERQAKSRPAREAGDIS